MLNLLFIGDISGKIGRRTIEKLLPKIKKEYRADLVIANAENSAHGSGITATALEELRNAGVDFFTGGDHSFDNVKHLSACYEGNFSIIRPANFPPENIGKGYDIINVKGHSIAIINLMGRVFMSMDYDCPFRKADEILSNLANNNLSAIIVDIHAEATSEKISLAHYLDGKVSAVVGTHTHVQTADAKISSAGTAYITDAGMVGLADGVIGVEKDGIIQTFLTQIKTQHIIPETGRAVLNAVLIKIEEKNKKATSIQPITKYINIK